MHPKVAYVYSEGLIHWCSRLPKVSNRAKLVHALIQSYELLNDLDVVPCIPSSTYELQKFHSTDYIDHIKGLNTFSEGEDDIESNEYGIGYDCPPFSGVYDCSRWLCGGTIEAAKQLLQGDVTTAINWCGGWHHAKKDEASGFCYFNDIVLGILTLRERFRRVLYVDFDLHHGDGVEDAFAYTDKVFTVSFHKFSPCFFPGSGDVKDVGFGRGKCHNVNVPIKDGITDDTYVALVARVLKAVKKKYSPDVVVCQFGADGLCTDDHRSFNLTPLGLSRCLKYLQAWRVPLLLLGGGGYNMVDTAKCWALLTATAVGRDIPTDIPEHKYFAKYGPDFSVEVTPSCRPDQNTKNSLDEVFTRILYNLQCLPPPPSTAVTSNSQ